MEDLDRRQVGSGNIDKNTAKGVSELNNNMNGTTLRREVITYPDSFFSVWMTATSA